MKRDLGLVLLALILLGLLAAVSGSQHLDPSEANVIGADYDQDGTNITFFVTIYHNNTGEEGYVDFWQVETDSGEVIGTHDVEITGSNRFTSTGSVSVPASIDQIVVRAHDTTHGFGGQAISIALERQDFSEIEGSGSGDPGTGGTSPGEDTEETQEEQDEEGNEEDPGGSPLGDIFDTGTGGSEGNESSGGGLLDQILNTSPESSGEGTSVWIFFGPIIGILLLGLLWEVWRR